nr:hypothetical protein CFP56_19509 [Quercus suber]
MSIRASYRDPSATGSVEATSGAHSIHLGLIIQLLCFAVFGVVIILHSMVVNKSLLAQRACTLLESSRPIGLQIETLVLSSKPLTVNSPRFRTIDCMISDLLRLARPGRAIRRLSDALGREVSDACLEVKRLRYVASGGTEATVQSAKMPTYRIYFLSALFGL